MPSSEYHVNALCGILCPAARLSIVAVIHPPAGLSGSGGLAMPVRLRLACSGHPGLSPSLPASLRGGAQGQSPPCLPETNRGLVADAKIKAGVGEELHL